MKVFFFFIDALGVGVNDPASNPCCDPALHIFNRFQDDGASPLPFEGAFSTLDATLAIPGRPQSATGQTTLLTGQNAAAHYGRHKTGYPNPLLRDLLFEFSILKRLAADGRKVAFLNAFPPFFFDNWDKVLTSKRLSATTLATLAAEIPFKNFDDLRQGQAVSYDLTNQRLLERNYDVPLYSLEQAGHNMRHTIESYDFALYEFFLTDKAGHKQDLEWARHILRDLEVVLFTLLAGLDLNEHLVFLTSDHGGVEDLSVRTHSLNPVMTMAWGARNHEFLASLRSIQDVAAAIEKRVRE